MKMQILQVSRIFLLLAVMLSFLSAFESRAADLAEGKQVTITGIARNAKLGAVVFSDGQTIYLKDKSSWESGILNETVRVSGILQKFETPRATQNNGEWSAGVTEGESAYRLENFKWDRVSAAAASNAKVLRPSDPTTLSSLAELKADPGRWDRKPVVYEGLYEMRFEVSTLDREIWVGFKPQTEVLNEPPNRNSFGAHRVRVTGILFAEPGAHYGHLGGYKYEILASKIEYLAKAP
jgi:hypothetical protein